MKLKENFVLRQVADTWIVMPIDTASVDFNGMLTLNESGALLWRTMEQDSRPEALANALTAEYDVSPEQALADAKEFMNKLVEAGCAEE